MWWTQLTQWLAQPLTYVPVALSLQYITDATLCGAGAIRLGSPPAPDTWDTETFGRGRLPSIDDQLLPLEWGDLQVLHTTDIHGCTSLLTGVPGPSEAFASRAKLQW